MNSELLERLLLDRALGQLSPDVEMLLQEILAADSPTTQLAAQFQETVALAAGVLKSPAPLKELPPRVVSAFPRRRVERWLPLAASFALGAGAAALALAGSGVRPEASPPPAIAHTAPPSAPANPPPPSVEREVRSLPFWSTRRVYLLAASARQPNQH